MRFRLAPAEWSLAGSILLSFLALASIGRAETLRVATYNVENYTLADRMTADGYKKNYPKPEVEKSRLREVIRALDADVLVLEEMGSPMFLQELAADLESEGVRYPTRVVLEGADADRHVALLSKRPLLKQNSHRSLMFSYFGKPEAVKRGVLDVTIETRSGPLTIFGIHLKSRITDRGDDPQSALRRESEAAAVRDCIQSRVAELESPRFLILGDFNDTADSQTVQMLLKLKLSSPLAILPAADTHGEVWTHFYRRERSKSRIDFILMPVTMVSSTKTTGLVYDAPNILIASDHRPVMAILDL